MPSRQRKVEVYGLKISGLAEGTEYGDYICGLRNRPETLETFVMERGTKSHALYSAEMVGQRVRLQFLSFTTGHRPDLFDTEVYSVEPNPLPPTKTGVEWTHALGSRIGERFIVLVEKFQAGIWPGTIEKYLQWLQDAFEPHNAGTGQDEQTPVVVSMEAVAGQEFIQRLDALTRVTKATLRIVRPNPGWYDFDSELATQSADSDAHKSDVTMTARRNATLRRNNGIVAAIKRLFTSNELDFAAVEGQRDGERDQFNTEHLGKSVLVSMRLDDQGQIVHDDAWDKLSHIMDGLQ